MQLFQKVSGEGFRGRFQNGVWQVLGVSGSEVLGATGSLIGSLLNDVAKPSLQSSELSQFTFSCGLVL